MTPNDPIRQALLAAAEEDLRQALAHAPEAPAFSPRYRAWEARFRRDPRNAARRRGRPRWQGLARRAACFLLVASLSLGSLLYFSPQARAWVKSWFTEQHEDHVTYRFQGEDLPTEALRDWVPTYLPDGYEQTDYIDLKNIVSILYNNDDPNMEIELSYQLLMEGGGENLDNERHVISSVSIHDMPGYLYTATDDSQNMLVWFDEVNRHAFLLMSRVDCDTLVRIAESVVMKDRLSI